METNRERKQANERRKGRAVQGGGVKRLLLLRTIFEARAAAAAKKG